MSEPNAAAAAAAAAHDSAVERALEAAAAEASTAAVMDVELPALPPADGEGGMPPLDAVAAAAAAATPAAAAPAQAVRYVPIGAVCHVTSCLFDLLGAFGSSRARFHAMAVSMYQSISGTCIYTKFS